MLDFLSSPVLFPSDMDSPKLSAGAIFKLPETMNWADYDYYNTMVDKSTTGLTDLTRLEPVNENDMHVYEPFILDGGKLNTGGYLEKTATGGLAGDYSKQMALLGLAQSMVQAYSFPFSSTPVNTGVIGRDGDSDDDDDDSGKQRKILRANLRGALDVVEHDMQKNGHDSLYSGSTKQQYDINNNDFLHSNFIGVQWSWREEIVDVPDLVHSICSSPSTHSLADDHHPSTPVLLESGISSFVENDTIDQQQTQKELGRTVAATPVSVSASPSLHSFQNVDDKKKSRPIKKWMNKMKQATSAVKQDCTKSISSASRKLCQWIKK